MSSYSISNGLAIGSVPLSISDIVAFMPDFFEGHSMLLTFVDSGAPSCLTADYYQKEGIELVPYGDALLIRSADISSLLRNGWPFDGFEELFLIKEPLPKLVPALSTHFTSERCNFGKEIPPEFSETFHALNAVRFLADGCGLNFACEPEQAESIVKLTEHLNKANPTSPVVSEGRGQ